MVESELAESKVVLDGVMIYVISSTEPAESPEARGIRVELGKPHLVVIFDSGFSCTRPPDLPPHYNTFHSAR